MTPGLGTCARLNDHETVIEQELHLVVDWQQIDKYDRTNKQQRVLELVERQLTSALGFCLPNRKYCVKTFSNEKNTLGNDTHLCEHQVHIRGGEF